MPSALPNLSEAAAARASRARLAPPALLGLVLLSVPALGTQEAVVPAPAAPAAARLAARDDSAQRRTPATPAAGRPSTPLPAQAPRAPQARPAAAPAAPTPAAAPAAPKPPRQVVTVVHRLSGWKLLTWLATSGPPLLEIDNLPTALDVHTNIVAGFVHSDGRKVIARLAQGGAEAEQGTGGPPPGLLPGAQGFGQSEFMLITGDGRRLKADFVGMDAATGLSVLEAPEPLFVAQAGDEGHTEDPSVGQRVLLYAPAQVAAVTPAAPPSKRSPAAAEEGVIYLSIDQADGRLTAVTRAPSGKPFNVTARAERVTSAWTGAVATNEAGALVGIVAQSGPGETQIVSGEMVRQAVERVQARRANVPQPWLGVRGDAAFRAPLESWVDRGWKPESALPLIKQQQGVLLTSVPPGTPAALAGLRPGDVIGRVGERDVRTAEDLSLMLKELPVGSTVDFTVWRAFEPEPLKLAVQLRGTQNPALSTAEAEALAARASIHSVRDQIRAARLEEQRLRVAGREARPDELARLSDRLRRAELQLAEALTQVNEAELRIAEARAGVPADALTTPDPARPQVTAVRRPLQSFGLQVVGLTPRTAARLGARGGVLVVSVRPSSPAAASGLLPGDVIETVDGRTFTRQSFSRLGGEAAAGPLSLGVVRLRKRLTVPFALNGQ